MPPQQPDRLLDLFDEAFDFGAHGCLCSAAEAAVAEYEGCSGARSKAQITGLESFPFRWNGTRLQILALPRFLCANRYPLRSKTL
jgi:hypothetical protein